MNEFPSPARDLSERLSARALDVCRTYLSNGRRCGRYWSVGDVANSRGRSLYVRLTGPASGRGAAGRWTDAATGERGDLLDLLRASQRLNSLAETLNEARRFLGQPRVSYTLSEHIAPHSPEAPRRLFALGRLIPGTLAERYLRARGIAGPLDLDALRYHPRVYCRELGPDRTLPALLAAVTDASGRITGVQRTWLNPHGLAKAPLAEPRRALGALLGNAVRFGPSGDVLLAGEGIETVLSLRELLPGMPMVAAGSANHLGALSLPTRLRRLYVARDEGRDGVRAAERLRERARGRGVRVVVLAPRFDDFNTDLSRLGLAALSGAILPRLRGDDALRFARAGDAAS